MNNNLESQNRPLEFRAWHIPTQQMCYNVAIDPFNPARVIYVHKKGRSSHVGKNESGDYVRTSFDAFKRDECILMQYSGILDRKGIKIWEGDITYWSYVNQRENIRGVYYTEVIFRAGAFGGKGDLDESIDAFCGALPKYRKRYYEVVVGNVYQHPELLDLTGDFPLRDEKSST